MTIIIDLRIDTLYSTNENYILLYSISAGFSVVRNQPILHCCNKNSYFFVNRSLSSAKLSIRHEFLFSVHQGLSFYNLFFL